MPVNNIPEQNNVDRAADLSELQVAILEALPKHDEKPVPTATVLQRVRAFAATSPTNAQRSSVSRSLSRLAEHGHALRYVPEMARPGRGALWSKARP